MGSNLSCKRIMLREEVSDWICIFFLICDSSDEVDSFFLWMVNLETEERNALWTNSWGVVKLSDWKFIWFECETMIHLLPRRVETGYLNKETEE